MFFVSVPSSLGEVHSGEPVKELLVCEAAAGGGGRVHYSPNQQ